MLRALLMLQAQRMLQVSHVFSLLLDTLPPWHQFFIIIYEGGMFLKMP